MCTGLISTKSNYSYLLILLQIRIISSGLTCVIDLLRSYHKNPYYSFQVTFSHNFNRIIQSGLRKNQLRFGKPNQRGRLALFQCGVFWIGWKISRFPIWFSSIFFTNLLNIIVLSTKYECSRCNKRYLVVD